MFEPTSLFHYENSVDKRTVHDRVLVITLGSYGDAGSAQAQLDEHLLNTLAHRRLGSFDVDQITDYREHRPTIDLDLDHYANYAAPAMELHELTDKSGAPFLLLTGPEPSLQWERVAGSIERIVDELDVQLVVTAQGIPMPVPHTRPVTLTKLSTRPELLPGNQGIGSFRMSASFSAMMTQRLGEKSLDVINLAAHVPQYLTDNEYPQATIALVHGLNLNAGLDVPMGDLEQAARLVRGQIDAQVNVSEQLQQVISQLEGQYDRFMAGRSLPVNGENLPDAEEIGRAVEDFLASLDDEGGQDGDAGNPPDDEERGGGPQDSGPHDGPEPDHGQQ
ncbi:proteasome assembly chaperone family protein [Propionibacterium acidifaciens]|uniref:PAC2 family protein n=1 Tax=Propionibacterium acidifaciens F0233 TaxID=553198 RepID=U2RNQ4_9ACTN|nr:PAC2 family protein [Propionibacterium acidifaciens]ERK55193.1 PAC2 family protein [Propionibacterium acidifaciens F0233]